MFILLSGVVPLLGLLVDGIHSEALNQSNFRSCVRRTNGLACYTVMDSQDLWGTAQSVCNALNMTMLEILTDEENTAVHDLLKEENMVDSWLDAFQSSESWRWLDGTELGDQGCFGDNVTNPDMEHSVDFPFNNSVTNCIAHCKSLDYSYASVEAGTKCGCDYAFGKYGQEGANCGIQCPGDVSQSCGGNLPTSQQIYAVDGATANWLGGQPNNNNGYQSCGAMDSANGFKWQDVFCRDGYKAICEIPFANNSCTNSKATLVNGRCLMIIEQGVNYFSSRFTCRSLGGDLAMHLTSTDSLAIARWLNLAPNSTVLFYVGLVKWQWKWQTGSEFLYTNWKYDQPTGPNFNCITIKQNSLTGDWMAIGCDTNHLYICQKTNATLKVTAPPFTVAPSTTAKRTAPPPLSMTNQGSSSFPTPRSPTDQQSQPASDKSSSPSSSSSSNSTSISANAAIIGGAVAGGIMLLIVIIIVVVIIVVNGGATCCTRRKETATEKGELPKADATIVPSPPSYFFGVGSTVRYDKKPSHPAIPDFSFVKVGSTIGRNNKLTTPDVIPARLYPMATPYDDDDDVTLETKAPPNPYSSDIYINPEMSY